MNFKKTYLFLKTSIHKVLRCLKSYITRLRSKKDHVQPYQKVQDLISKSIGLQIDEVELKIKIQKAANFAEKIGQNHIAAILITMLNAHIEGILPDLELELNRWINERALLIEANRIINNTNPNDDPKNDYLDNDDNNDYYDDDLV